LQLYLGAQVPASALASLYSGIATGCPAAPPPPAVAPAAPGTPSGTNNLALGKFAWMSSTLNATACYSSSVTGCTAATVVNGRAPVPRAGAHHKGQWRQFQTLLGRRVFQFLPHGFHTRDIRMIELRDMRQIHPTGVQARPTDFLDTG
jgi:hypothetical protein